MDKRFLVWARLLIVAALPLFAASQSFAQASRTWVSGVGDDANPCSRTAPCKTFAGAISKTAAGGEISVLDPGGYGAVTITKAITIDGDGTLASVLVSGTNAIVISAGPSDVVILRNLSINGIGFGLDGIRFLAGGELHVDNMSICGFTGQAISFLPNGASALFVANSKLRNNTAGAVLIQPTASGTATATIDTVYMDGNGRGLRAEDGSTVVIRNSHATGNSANGFVAISTAGSPRAINMNLESSESSNNGATGVYAGGSSIVRLSNVTITNNHDGLQTVGGTSVSFGNNRINGNQLSNGPASITTSQQ